MGVVMEAFNLRDLSGKAGWQEAAAEIEAEGGRSESFLCGRVNRVLLCSRVDGGHPGHGGGVGWQGGEVI